MNWEPVVAVKNFLWNKRKGTKEEPLLSYFDKILFVFISNAIQTKPSCWAPTQLTQFRFFALLPPPLLLLAWGFGAEDPPPRNLDSISETSGISPPSFGNCRFSISFLVSGSLMILGNTSSRSRGRIIMRTIGENRKSVIFHCSRCWKYLKVVRAFSFSG